mmetsp:Transcript_62450/g.190981  ORF Transcript_62450/g.190981 Transcript_62450/m.190981 type:complete len:241 (+) Transcript_62450:1311-2033(+)
MCVQIVVGHHLLARAGGALADVVLGGQAAHELFAPLLDVFRHLLLTQLAVGLAVLALGAVQPAQALRPELAEPRVPSGLPRSQAGSLVLAQHMADELLANGVRALRQPDLLVLHVLLIPEWEAPAEEAVSDDPHRPHVHLQPVAPVVELGGPKDLGPYRGIQPLPGLQARGSPKIRQHDRALRVRDVRAVHQVVVTLDVPVDDAVAHQILNAGADLRLRRDGGEGVDQTLGLEVPLEAFH